MDCLKAEVAKVVEAQRALAKTGQQRDKLDDDKARFRPRWNA